MKTGIATLLLAMGAAMAVAEASNVDTQGATDDTGAAYIEEIEVLGELSTFQLGKLVTNARLDFYELYNSLNGVDEFRVSCDKQAATGTNLKKLSCVPAYYSEAAANMTWEQSLQYLRTGRGIGLRTPSQRNFIDLTREKKKEADAHMIALIESNPALREKYEYLLAANKAYEQSKR